MFIFRNIGRLLKKNQIFPLKKNLILQLLKKNLIHMMNIMKNTRENQLFLVVPTNKLQNMLLNIPTLCLLYKMNLMLITKKNLL